MSATPATAIKETPKEDIKDLLPLVLQLTNSEQVDSIPYRPAPPRSPLCSHFM